MTSNQECVEYCPLGETYIGNGNKCKNKCDALIDGQYYKKNNPIETNPSYIIYEWKREYPYKNLRWHK